MGLIRPATPGFLVTLTATIILAVVSFSVPYFKSVFFLKASLSYENIDGYVTFGVLGYCTDIAGNSTCSKPSVGYELDINSLVGNKLKIEIPTVVVKWITYALVLHLVALGLAAISAVFGLLAHVREMSMVCCSSCFSGISASVALIAFIFDLVLFYVAKARINKVQGGKAEIGNGIWLTLAAWVLLFFSGCFFGLGRCCIRRRPGGRDRDTRDDGGRFGGLAGWKGSSNRDEEMRLDAVKAEADRKAAQKRGEIGLPAFHETDQSVPLKARVDGNEVYLEDDHATQPYQDRPRSQSPPRQYAAGYVPAPAGERAIDQLNAPPRRQQSAQTTTTYPPQPHPERQGSGHSHATGYSSSAYQGYGNAAAAAVPAAAAVAAAAPSAGQYLSPHGTGQSPYGSHQQYPTNTSYQSAATHQQPSEYYDPYTHSQPQPGAQQGYYTDASFNPDTYNTTGAMMMPSMTHTSPYGIAGTQNQYYTSNQEPQSYYGAQTTSAAMHAPAERSYTLGGSGYGANVVPAPTPSPQTYLPYSGQAPSPQPLTQHQPQPTYPAAQVNTVAGPHTATSPVRMTTSPTQLEDSPPGYDGPLGSGTVVPEWGVKR